jgi:hypothetical protein
MYISHIELDQMFNASINEVILHSSMGYSEDDYIYQLKTINIKVLRWEPWGLQNLSTCNEARSSCKEFFKD